MKPYDFLFKFRCTDCDCLFATMDPLRVKCHQCLPNPPRFTGFDNIVPCECANEGFFRDGILFRGIFIDRSKCELHGPKAIKPEAGGAERIPVWDGKFVPVKDVQAIIDRAETCGYTTWRNIDDLKALVKSAGHTSPFPGDSRQQLKNKYYSLSQRIKNYAGILNYVSKQYESWEAPVAIRAIAERLLQIVKEETNG